MSHLSLLFCDSQDTSDTKGEGNVLLDVICSHRFLLLWIHRFTSRKPVKIFVPRDDIGPALGRGVEFGSIPLYEL